MSNNNDVTFTRPEHQAASAQWKKNRDVCSGPIAVKAAGHVYLPMLSPNDKAALNQQRNADYLTRAVFYGIVGHTRIGLQGLAFRKPPALEIPDKMDKLKTNADGSNTSIIQQSQFALESVLEVGRHGLYVDYAEAAEQGIIVAYRAEDVINWRTENIGGMNKYVLIVLRECIEKPDGFSFKDEIQYRVLRLIEGKLIVELWTKNSESAGTYTINKTMKPQPKGKTHWDEIPFTFIGAQNNDAVIDDAPLSSLVEINLGHYRNSADYEDSVFFCGQAQPWVSGADSDWREYIKKNGIAFGSRNPIMLPKQGSCGIMQGQPNMIVREAMNDKVDYMIKLGARLLEQNATAKTATQSSGEQAASTSILGLCCANVSAAYTQALKWCARYMGQPEEKIKYELNQDFIAKLVDPQTITALVSAWMNKALPIADLIRQLQKMDVIDPGKDLNAIMDELNSEGPNFMAGGSNGAQ